MAFREQRGTVSLTSSGQIKAEAEEVVKTVTRLSIRNPQPSEKDCRRQPEGWERQRASISNLQFRRSDQIKANAEEAEQESGETTRRSDQIKDEAEMLRVDAAPGNAGRFERLKAPSISIGKGPELVKGYLAGGSVGGRAESVYGRKSGFIRPKPTNLNGSSHILPSH